MKKLKVRTLVLSDVHLGTPSCRVHEVNHLLKHVRCEKLILNGDIIDGWQLARSGNWTTAHTRFVRLVLKTMEKRGTRVVYLRGNHDDILARFLPMQFDHLEIVEDHVHEGPRGKYFVFHGDVLDAITVNMVWLSHLGDLGYRLLLRLNRAYNAWRAWRGREYYSISKAIKARVKGAVNFVSKFEDRLPAIAKQHGCTGVICGHIHTPADKLLGDVHYLNSGDWVESLTALAEHHDGRWELLEFARFRQHFPFREPLAGEEPADIEDEHEAPEPIAARAATIPG